MRREYRRIIRMATRNDWNRFSCQEVRAGGGVLVFDYFFMVAQFKAGYVADRLPGRQAPCPDRDFPMSRGLP
jgi:hypothetical protein